LRADILICSQFGFKQLKTAIRPLLNMDKGLMPNAPFGNMINEVKEFFTPAQQKEFLKSRQLLYIIFM